jgi:predicted esterase
MKESAVAILGLALFACGDSESEATGSGGAGGGGAAPASQTPIVPEASEACPDLTSGTRDIMGLTTTIVAGAPGSTKGPLLFLWHGTGGDGDGVLRGLPSSVQDDIVSQGGIIVAPTSNGEEREGRDVTIVLGVWYDGADLLFTDLIAACAVQNHNVDPRRIYTSGCSAGGLMAGVMSLERSSYVAAAVPNSGGTVITDIGLQDNERVPALMTMHGGEGDTVIVNFAETSHNLQNMLKPAGAFIVECNHGMGHCGAPDDLLESAWDFMQAHPFGTRPSPYVSGLPADFPSYCSIQ